jgi:hypothetical protein
VRDLTTDEVISITHIAQQTTGGASRSFPFFSLQPEPFLCP